MGFGDQPFSPDALEERRAQEEESKMMRPAQPVTVKDSRISVRVIEGLILKTIKQEGALNEQELSSILLLAPNVFRDFIQSMVNREVLDTPSPLTYDLTNKGRELTSQYEAEDAYVGPAPVHFDDYCERVVAQAEREKRVTMEDVERNFEKFPMAPEVLRILKEGFNSQRVIIFWGPPGNGKSLVTDNLHRLLKHPVLLPYAFEFNNRIVQVYDPAFHTLEEDLMAQEEEATSKSVTAATRPDRRWLISRPPLVTVGTEFRVEHFQIAYDGKYDAPPHVKANNGIFIFDDLGRQTQDHNMILNQFIYPLEQREAIIKFAGGSSLRVPYRQRLFLSTNLNFKSIIDDAFSRRLLYQVLLDRPADPIWKKIVINICHDHGLPDDLAIKVSRVLLGWYKRDGRVIRAADPRNIFVMMDAALEEGQTMMDVFNFEVFERVYNQYPMAAEKDAVGYSTFEVLEEDEFVETAAEAAKLYDIDDKLARELGSALYQWLQEDGYMARRNDPGNLFAIVDGLVAEEKMQLSDLNLETFKALYSEYPAYTEEDARRAAGMGGIGGE